MEISNTSFTEIKKLAEFIASEYEAFITPLDSILESEGINVFYDDYGSAFDGMLVHDNDFYIHINTKRGNKPNTPRGRFTLAHELGHYFIDNHRLGLQKGILQPHPSKNNEAKYQKIEREADYFASCLLMPEKRFLKGCFKHKFKFSIIKELATAHNISLTACALRFADIGNHPITVVYCEDGHIKWKWNSKDFPFKYLAETNNKIPEHSLVGNYFATKKGVSKTDQLWAADWFSCYNHEDEDRKIYEHFIPYKNKVLSIIWED